ncbi:hypothetical protein NDU88_000320 [Pleurodeles waltl]|uniref:Uncharacterized protein n=1 Tax=Pleurodeles waltl TaxID=8319 RepID=A0AAV7TGD2_PLEWA|nr:hypothetical protein NDU88_000320 [Pleurodeles waltl]
MLSCVGIHICLVWYSKSTKNGKSHKKKEKGRTVTGFRAEGRSGSTPGALRSSPMLYRRRQSRRGEEDARGLKNPLVLAPRCQQQKWRKEERRHWKAKEREARMKSWKVTEQRDQRTSKTAVRRIVHRRREKTHRDRPGSGRNVAISGTNLSVNGEQGSRWWYEREGRGGGSENTHEHGAQYINSHHEGNSCYESGKEG